MWAFLRGDPATVARLYRPLLLGGLIGGYLVANAFNGVGIITAVHAGSLGAAGGSFQHWRTERGLWMLAGLFLVCFGAIDVLMIIGQLGDVLRGARAPSLAVTVDAAIGSLLLSVLIRFLFAVGKYNFELTRSERDA